MPEPRGKRDLIKTQALRLFVDRGIDTVSVRDIAAACAMKPSNLYAHFPSREALVAELFAEGYAAYGAILAAAAASPGAFRPRLARMLHAICRLHDEDTTRFRFLLLSQHGGLAHVPDDAPNPVDIVCQAVAAAMQAGEIPTREPGLMALALVGLIVQPATALLYGRLQGGLLSRSDVIIDMAWRALS
jgi:AcrR family transcriptional regulator